MGVALDRVTIFSALVVALGLVGFAQAAEAGSDREPSGRLEAAVPAANVFMLPPKTSPIPANASAPSVRPLEAGDTISGSEPDPEAFDQGGLETWWRNYQEHLKRAE